MGTDKRYGSSLLGRVGLLAVLGGLCWLRLGYYQAHKLRLAVGDKVEMTFRVGDVSFDSGNRRWVEAYGTRIYLSDGVLVMSGQKIRIIGTVEETVISKGVSFLTLDARELEMLDIKPDLRGRAAQVREKLEGMYMSWLPFDEASLAVGLLLGGSDQFSRELREAYSRAGVSHVVAASGYNVAVVGGWAMMLGQRAFGKRRSIPFVVFCIVLYMFLAGLALPVVRAGVMAIVAFGGLVVGRKADVGWSLILTVVGMILVYPEWVSEVSFQLSVGATAGLVWLSPGMWEAAVIGGLQREKWWVSDLKVSLVAWIATMPIVLHHFGKMSVVAPIVNSLILWTVPLAMQILAVALVVGSVISGLGSIVAILAWPLLKLFNTVAMMVGNWGYSQWMVGEVSWWWVGGYYGVMAIYLLRKRLLQTVRGE